MVVMEATVHPSSEKLRAFGQGRLPAPEAAAIEGHLSGCDTCCLSLEATPVDSFVGRLREALDAEPVGAISAEPGELAEHPRYRLIRLLGQGGMGAVYLAEHRHMGRAVALKVIKPDLLNHPRSLPRFLQEVRAAAKLDHPNIVAAYDADQAGALHFLVMEYVEGQNLADYLADNGPLPLAKACDIVRQAALGVQHAHERGMVHRDIKPHNLMLTSSGQVKVLDFGLARFAAEPDGFQTEEDSTTASYLTAAGAVMGTADYIAPEQARDARGADSRSDVYSLGCTLHHLLTGRTPYPERAAPQKLPCPSAAEPRTLSALRPDAPVGLARVLAKMMARRPEDRYQTAAEAAAALESFSRNATPPRSKLRRALLALGFLALLVLSLAAAGVVRLPSGPDREVVIETNDPDVEVVVKGDRIVRIVHPKTGKAYQLDRTDLTLSLADDPDGLSLTLGERPVVLKRQGKRIAALWLERKPGTSPRTIQLEVVVAQFQRADARRLVSRWLDVLKDDAVTFGRVKSYRSFLTELHKLRETGQATVLAQPTVITLSGRPATIVDGGQVPIFTATSGTDDPTVSYKTSGVELHFLPTILDNGRIHLKGRAEFNTLLDAGPVPGDANAPRVPAFRTQRAHVDVELEDGQTLGISGLIQKAKDAEKELIMVVTPRLVDPQGTMLPKKTLKPSTRQTPQTNASSPPFGDQPKEEANVPTTSALVAYLNDNAQRMQSLRCLELDMTFRDGMQSFGMRGKLIVQRPRSFIMSADCLGKRSLDIGSNDREFWCWISKAEPPRQFYCSYRDLADGRVSRLPFPFQPDWILHTLGLGNYGPAERYHLATEGGTLKLVEAARSLAGTRIRNVIVFNRRPVKAPTPQVLAYLVMDEATGKEICSAHITETQLDRPTQAIVPRRLELRWTMANHRFKLTVRFDGLSVNEQISPEEFARRPLANMPSFNLATGQSDKLEKSP